MKMKPLQIKIEQIAFTTSRPQAAMDSLTALLGLDPKGWVEDRVTTTGYVYGERSPATTIASLFFNYDSNGTEIEILQYTSGPNWLSNKGKAKSLAPIPSHMAMHVKDLEELDRWKLHFSHLGIDIAQEVETQSHTNEFLLRSGRKYHYVIFDTEGLLGFDFKLIRRIES